MYTSSYVMFLTCTQEIQSLAYLKFNNRLKVLNVLAGTWLQC